MKDVNTLAQEIVATAHDLMNVNSKPGEAKPTSVIATVSALPDGSSAGRGGYPLALVLYFGKTFGVFWKGEGKNDAGPTVGIRKLVQSGRLHKGHRKFAPAKWLKISELAAHGNN